MFKKVAITNRQICSNLPEQIKKLHNSDFDYIILREKDLPYEDYLSLAKTAIEISDKIILHTYIKACEELNYYKIHLPLDIFMQEASKLQGYELVGVSAHSLDEAKKAEILGAHYITVSPIFRTNCKKDVEPKGLYWLKNICNNVSIPVYALGGINNINAQSCFEAKAEGVCMMSEAMK